jgi:hypothetical protein
MIGPSQVTLQRRQDAQENRCYPGPLPRPKCPGTDLDGYRSAILQRRLVTWGTTPLRSVPFEDGEDVSQGRPARATCRRCRKGGTWSRGERHRRTVRDEVRAEPTIWLAMRSCWTARSYIWGRTRRVERAGCGGLVASWFRWRTVIACSPGRCGRPGGGNEAARVWSPSALPLSSNTVSGRGAAMLTNLPKVQQFHLSSKQRTTEAGLPQCPIAQLGGFTDWGLTTERHLAGAGGCTEAMTRATSWRRRLELTAAERRHPRHPGQGAFEADVEERHCRRTPWSCTAITTTGSPPSRSARVEQPQGRPPHERRPQEGSEVDQRETGSHPLRRRLAAGSDGRRCAPSSRRGVMDRKHQPRRRALRQSSLADLARRAPGTAQRGGYILQAISFVRRQRDGTSVRRRAGPSTEAGAGHCHHRLLPHREGSYGLVRPENRSATGVRTTTCPD